MLFQPYPCTWVGCNKRFTRNYDMRVHVKEIHERQKDLVDCPICKKGYARRHIDQHIKAHSTAVLRVAIFAKKTSNRKWAIVFIAQSSSTNTSAYRMVTVSLALGFLLIDFKYLRLQSIAALWTRILLATTTANRRSSFARKCARYFRYKRSNARRFTFSSKWRRRTIRHLTATSRRSSTASSTLAGPRASTNAETSIESRRERCAG